MLRCLLFLMSHFILLGVVGLPSSFAQEGPLRIEAIEIEGLNRTAPHIVTRELLFEEGDEVTVDDIEESIQRVRNMEIFDTVEYELEAIEEGYRLQIDAAERWTILPILQFSFGGDVSRIRLGVYDLNLLGRYLELGGEYRYIAGTHSFGLWFYEPRVFGELIRLELEAWRDRELFYRYDFDGELQGGFMRQREFGGIVVEPELDRHIRARTGLRLERTRFVLDGVPDEVRQVQDVDELMSTSWIVRLATGITVGRMDRREYLDFGQELSFELELFRSVAGAPISHVEPRLRLLAFRELPWKSNLGLRLEWRGTTSVEQGFHHYVGGLDHIRGYRYSRFSGRHYWNGNLEYRIPSLDHRLLAIQHVAFVDGLGIGEKFSDLAGITAGSVGIGLRLIVPPVYGLILRFDLAYPIGAPGEAYFSAGSLQFF